MENMHLILKQLSATQLSLNIFSPFSFSVLQLRKITCVQWKCCESNNYTNEMELLYNKVAGVLTFQFICLNTFLLDAHCTHTETTF